MKNLYDRLASLKIILNSYYGDVETVSQIYEKTHQIKDKILKVKRRIAKIKKVFNERY